MNKRHKRIFRILLIALCVLAVVICLFFLPRCCSSERQPPGINVPTVFTFEVTSIGEVSAQCGGNVTADGGNIVEVRGVCWSTSPEPTVNGPHSRDGYGLGEFVSTITGLQPNTTYYVRAYAINCNGTSYGEQRNSWSTQFK